MTSATVPGLDTAPTNHEGLLSWVEEVAELISAVDTEFGSEKPRVRADTRLGSPSLARPAFSAPAGD